MYWRINCTEHLSLDLTVDPKQPRTQPRTSQDQQQQPQQQQTPPRSRFARPRSATYSTGPGASLDILRGLRTRYSPLDVSQTVQRFVASADRKLVCGITQHGIYLWSLKPFTLLSSLEYDPIDEFGVLVDIAWKPDSHTLFAVLRNGYVYEVSVYEREEPALEYRFAVQHYFVRGPGEAHGIPSVGLAQRRTYKLPGNETTAMCAASGTHGAMVATRTHVHWLSWDGAMKKSMGVRDIYDNPLVHICQMVPIECRHGLSTVSVDMFLFSDGSVHMAFAGSSDGKQPATIRTLRAQDVAGKFTVLDYSSTNQTVAVGTTSGEVLVYGVKAGSLEPVAKISFDHGKAAHVSAVSWTPDGAAVACGYSTGHIVVRTVLGYELNATHLANQPAHLQQGDTVAPAPSLLAWGQGATRLFAFSDCLAGQDRTLVAQQVDSLPFVRAALSTMPGEGNSKHICLYSDDKVFIHHCEFEAQDLGAQQQGLLWHVAQIPATYIGDNWPVRFVAADDDGQHIAIAGAHGLASYSLASGKWRLFRNQQQEASVSCVGGMLWYRDYLVVACINHDCQDAPQLLFFPKSRPLDTTSDLHTVALESEPVSISCHNSILLVYCRNQTVYQYAIFDDANFIQVSFRRSVDLSQFTDANRLRSLQWVPSALFDHRPAFLVHQGTTLRVLQETDDDQISAMVVSDKCEFTITSGVNFGNMHSIVWWFNGTQLFASLVSLEDFMDGGTTSLLDASQTRRMRIRPEFFPVAISADRGMAVGIDQDWTLEEHAVIGLSKLPVRAKLYVHTILDHMLGEGAEQDALMYAGCFEHWRFFPHAMEILLHEVLEREIDTRQQQNHSGLNDGRVLPRVIRMLENFSQFDEIVVHCARKTEAAFWGTLFDCLGGPVRFFKQCLAKQKLETATQCLIILQTLEPSETSTRLVLSLLEMAVRRQNRDLCLEILRFLKMTETTTDPSMHGLLTKLHEQAAT